MLTFREKGFFDSTIDFHVQHGILLYQLRNNRCRWQWGNTGGRLSQCYNNEAVLCCYPLAGLLLGQQQRTSCPVKLFPFREGSHLLHQLPVLGLRKQMINCVRSDMHHPELIFSTPVSEVSQCIVTLQFTGNGCDLNGSKHIFWL